MIHADDWQRKAVEMYPQLGISGSPQNAKYWALHKERLRTNPDFFKNPQWPFLLAKESGDLLKIQPVSPPATPPGPPPESPEMAAGKKLYTAKCGRCHDTFYPGVEEMTWNRWIWKWKNRAGLSNDEYDQLMDYARRVRESRAAKTGQ
ncbi:MAG: hypothetical protein FJ388_10195 [Verrucomicrobia bacterium]|nr:hypothetical protein [Verrucomicrobiota bacterium]